jgi:hypothetical protein
MDRSEAFLQIPPTPEEIRSLHPLTGDEAAQLGQQISKIDHFDPKYSEKKLIITETTLRQILDERSQPEGEHNE